MYPGPVSRKGVGGGGGEGCGREGEEGARLLELLLVCR